MEKVFFLFVVGLLASHFLYAQNDWRLQLGDEWYNAYGSKSLKVGDTMPDIPLGRVMNNYTGKNKFSDFRGKLVILDMWSTTCTSCISNFPRMEKLQQEFGDRIQVLLVNPYETEDEIRKSQQRAKFRLPNLPSIVVNHTLPNPYASEKLSLKQLFPVRGVPHHVWIDQKGVVRLMGLEQNTYPEKIKDMLAGKDVFVLKGINGTPSIGSHEYFKQLAHLSSTPLVYGSFITPYTNELNGIGRREIIDSIAKTRITHFINEELLSLYLWCTRVMFHTQSAAMIWPGDDKQFVVFSKGIDTLHFASSYAIESKKHLSDSEAIKSKYCYEQVVPLDLPEEKRFLYMMGDINRYFGQHYGKMAKVEQRTVKCYTLVRTSAIDKVQTDISEAGSLKKGNIGMRDQPVSKYSSSGLCESLYYSIKANPILVDFLDSCRKNGEPFFIINDTGWDNRKKTDMLLPVQELHNMDDLRKVLRKYDIDMIKKEKVLMFLVFS